MSWSLWRPSIWIPAVLSKQPGLPVLEYPVHQVRRISVLGVAVQQTKEVRCFPDWTCKQLTQADPQALAGSFDDLAEVARLEADKYLLLPSLQYPLLVFNRPEQGPLTELQHERLWRWFRLPVFEQFRDADGRLLAYECDAREGFHLVPGISASAVGGRAHHAQCGCGRQGSLLTFHAAVAAGEGS